MADSIIGYGYDSFQPDNDRSHRSGGGHPEASGSDAPASALSAALDDLASSAGCLSQDALLDDSHPVSSGLDDQLSSDDRLLPDDRQLIVQLQAGQEQAYELLLARFQQPVYNLVYRLLNDPTETSDVVQEVFLKVFRSISSFRQQSALKTWIYRIAIHESYNHRRWFSRHRRQEVELDAEDEAGSRVWNEPVADRGYDPYVLLLNEERHQMLEEALREINPVFRSALVLRDMEDASYEEIAEILQISLGTVKSRILRGREALRKVLNARVEEQTKPATAGNPNLAWMPGVVK